MIVVSFFTIVEVYKILCFDGILIFTSFSFEYWEGGSDFVNYELECHFNAQYYPKKYPKPLKGDLDGFPYVAVEDDDYLPSAILFKNDRANISVNNLDVSPQSSLNSGNVLEESVEYIKSIID